MYSFKSDAKCRVVCLPWTLRKCGVFLSLNLTRPQIKPLIGELYIWNISHNDQKTDPSTRKNFTVTASHTIRLPSHRVTSPIHMACSLRVHKLKWWHKCGGGVWVITCSSYAVVLITFDAMQSTILHEDGCNKKKEKEKGGTQHVFRSSTLYTFC